ncbi:HAMP domain-containing histidine kinase [Puteibacter caeruleilacunae]|nr:HAMP domain-containing histidine kinase [Puteibacter caeruleilacunae]
MLKLYNTTTFLLFLLSMKQIKHQKYLVIGTFLGLILLVFIQVNWIVKAAKLEEQNFANKVYMALAKSKGCLSKRVKQCTAMQDMLCGKHCVHGTHKAKLNELDSIISSNLDALNIDLDYTFEVVNQKEFESRSPKLQSKCYIQSLNGILENEGVQISVRFPNRNQFILAQIRGMFITSIFIILFITIVIIVMLRILKEEVALSERTRDFINNMVHEFQTPLANIGLAASLINKKESNKTGSKIPDYLNIITSEKEKLQLHVEEILKISSFEKHERPELTIIDIKELLNDLKEQCSYRIKSQNGSCNLILEATEYKVKGVKLELFNCLSNLVDNAIKYAKDSPEIKLRTLNQVGHLVIEIEDKGIGIEEKYLKLIWEKYYRVPTGNLHKIKGFGLGLTYVKKIIEAHGGTIDVSSIPQKGTIFSISLPIADE